MEKEKEGLLQSEKHASHRNESYARRKYGLLLLLSIGVLLVFALFLLSVGFCLRALGYVSK